MILNIITCDRCGESVDIDEKVCRYNWRRLLTFRFGVAQPPTQELDFCRNCMRSWDWWFNTPIAGFDRDFTAEDGSGES